MVNLGPALEVLSGGALCLFGMDGDSPHELINFDFIKMYFV